MANRRALSAAALPLLLFLLLLALPSAAVRDGCDGPGDCGGGGGLARSVAVAARGAVVLQKSRSGGGAPSGGAALAEVAGRPEAAAAGTGAGSKSEAKAEAKPEAEAETAAAASGSGAEASAAARPEAEAEEYAGSYAELSAEEAFWDAVSEAYDSGEPKSCKTYGCREYTPRQACQCNVRCKYYGNCCPDYADQCVKKAAVGEEVTQPLLLKFWGGSIATYLVVAAGVAVTIPSIQAKIHSIRVDADGSPSSEVAGASFMSREITDDTMLYTTWFSMRFKKGKLETMWQTESRMEKVGNSARTLTFVAVIMIIYRALRVVQSMRSVCGAPIFPGMKIAEFALLFAAFGGCLMCWKNPREELFWPLLGFFFFYVPASGLPPLNWSCHDLKYECASATDRYMRQAVNHVDCSLQGHTTMQMLMTWLLLQPWLIPRLDYMHLLWLWIFGVYLSWTLLYRYVFGEQVFDRDEIGYRVFLLCVTLSIAIQKKYRLETSQRLRFIHDLQQKESTKRMFLLFEGMVPAHVVPRMLAFETIADPYEWVSVLFVLIDEFDKFTNSKTPSQLLEFLNGQFTRFDMVCQAHRVTKIETVGEEYVACVGVMPEEKAEQERLFKERGGEPLVDGQEGVREHGHGFVLERLFLAAGAMLQLPQTGDKVQLKMGIQTGKIVAGVIGQKLPRFRLFGDTINSAARMMQKGLPGTVQYGELVKKHVTKTVWDNTTHRGKVAMKGKGEVDAWNYKPGPPGNAPASSDPVPAFSFDTETARNARRLRKTKGPDEDDDDDDEEDDDIGKPGAESVDERFETALSKVKEIEASNAHVSGGQHWILTEKDGFDEKMEADWFQHFHERSFANKIMRRFGTQALMIMFITGCELAFMIKVNVWQYPHSLYNSGLRWPVFVYSRGVAVFISMIMWHVSESTDWMMTNPLAAQSVTLLTSCLVIFLNFVSYDALVFSDTPGFRKQADLFGNFAAPEDQALALNFVISVFLITRMHNFLFYPSLVFVPLCICCVGVHYVYEWARPKGMPWEDFLSYQGELLIMVQVLINISVAYEDEQISRARFKAKLTVDKTQSRTKYILDTLMPPLVLKGLAEHIATVPKQVGSLTSHTYRHATVTQSDMCGFTELSSTKTPQEVVSYMGELFGRFDRLTDRHGVYKVETIGDAYIAAMAEKPLTEKNSPIDVVFFALDMVRECDDWSRELGFKVSCRAGVAHGECIGGIVGKGMQRYHLFGDLLTQMDLLEATSEPGRVQVSPAVKKEVERQLAERQVEIDQKGDFHTILPAGTCVLLKNGEHEGKVAEVVSFDAAKNMYEVFLDAHRQRKPEGPAPKTFHIEHHQYEEQEIQFQPRKDADGNMLVHLKTSKGETHELKEVGAEGQGTFLVSSNFPLRKTAEAVAAAARKTQAS